MVLIRSCFIVDSPFECPALKLRDEFRKLLGADWPTLMETHLFVGFAVGNSPMPHTSRVIRLAALIFKRQDHCHERLLGRPPGVRERIGENQALIWDDLEINTPARDIFSVRSA